MTWDVSLLALLAFGIAGCGVGIAPAEYVAADAELSEEVYVETLAAYEDEDESEGGGMVEAATEPPPLDTSKLTKGGGGGAYGTIGDMDGIADGDDDDSAAEPPTPADTFPEEHIKELPPQFQVQVQAQEIRQQEDQVDDILGGIRQIKCMGLARYAREHGWYDGVKPAEDDQTDQERFKDWLECPEAFPPEQGQDQVQVQEWR